jgi:methylase of polypeptide subunit release factors
MSAMSRYYTVRYGDIRVSYLPELDGGGMTFGQAFVGLVRERIGKVRHAFEFCAGPGFIGFSLLAHGLCERLTLADINPAAVRACEQTVRENRLEDRVAVYESDVLAGIPSEERWDLVVSNPPHFDGSEDSYRGAIRLIDPGFRIHRRFYADASRHLVPGGSILFQENSRASDVGVFAAMIEAGGLELLASIDGEPRGSWPGVALPDGIEQKMKNAVRRIALPIEQALMTPRIERLVKDNDLYRRLASHPALVPRHFYFLWSRARP